MPHLNLSFTDLDGTGIQSHDSNWMTYTGVSASDVQIWNNSVRRQSGNNGRFYYATQIGTTAFKVAFELIIKDNLTSGRGGVIVNASNTLTTDGYLFRANVSAGEWQLYKIDGDGFSIIDSAAFAFSIDGTYACEIKRNPEDDTLICSVDGTALCSTTDSAFKLNDRIGLRISDGTNIYIDNIVTSDLAASAPSITTADNITTEGQTATFTLANNTAAPTGAAINGSAVSNIAAEGSGVYSYTAPLIADDDTADLVVSVDGTTASAAIAYTNSYDRDQLTHPATEAEYSENSLSYPNAYATSLPYEWKVITGASGSVVVIDWDALELDDGLYKNIANYAAPVANGSTTVTLGVFVPETGEAYQFDRTITVSDGGVVVEGEGLFRSPFSALEKSLFKPLFR